MFDLRASVPLHCRRPGSVDLHRLHTRRCRSPSFHVLGFNSSSVYILHHYPAPVSRVRAHAHTTHLNCTQLRKSSCIRYQSL